MSDAAENIKLVKERIAKACKLPGRSPDSVELVAVSKRQPQGKIVEALDSGHRLFGENRVQEAEEHWESIKKGGDYPGLRLHLIGALQSNKARQAVALFDCIETIDRPKIVKAVAGEMRKQGRHFPCFVQVNVGDEEQKAGVGIDGLPGLLGLCREEGLEVAGLMCIPPVGDPPSMYFALLSDLARENSIRELSMGMSGDFEKAIPFGATYVRVGTAIFGERVL